MSVTINANRHRESTNQPLYKKLNTSINWEMIFTTHRTTESSTTRSSTVTYKQTGKKNNRETAIV